MRRNQFIVVALILLISFNSNCQTGKELFPKMKGWKLDKKIKVYNPDNLWDVINGAADNYLKFDFEELLMTDYKQKGGAYITTELYRHRTPNHAYGIYMQERPNEFTNNGIGAEGYNEPALLNFYIDKYYVKLRTHDNSKETLSAMQFLAKQIANTIQKNPLPPKILSYFPKSSRINDSEKFISKNFLGHSFLHTVFTMKYEVKGRKFSLFIIQLDSENDVAEMLEKYASFCKMELEIKPKGSAVFDDKYNGEISTEWQKNHIWGVVNLKDINLQKLFMDEIKFNIFPK